MCVCLCVQDTKLTNAAAWDSLAAGNGNEEEDGQKGAEEEEDNEGGLWNNFQARDDVERAEVCHDGCRQRYHESLKALKPYSGTMSHLFCKPYSGNTSHLYSEPYSSTMRRLICHGYCSSV